VAWREVKGLGRGEEARKHTGEISGSYDNEYCNGLTLFGEDSIHDESLLLTNIQHYS
jgi:hypothetical protein